eukprot:TRINITY_DN4148_c0_g1_i1.p1 TRINITY_DN4148_c0_g1~~TRINITY_DN4148_c0_g1_i1.p1  ORF type:complete len:365 (+),score=147.26 TRINITY_DN4148_c0_g1_i1:134-1228(+)
MAVVCNNEFEITTHIDIGHWETYVAKNEEGLPRVRRGKDESEKLFIWTYTPQTEFKKLWDPVTLQARGLVTDTEGRIVARPFPKFFNVQEMWSYKPDGTEEVVVYDKLDGSIGILFFHDGRWKVASKASLNSSHSKEAEKMLEKYDTTVLNKGCTYVLEMIFPENRIVVDYGNRRELIITAIFETATGREIELEGNCSNFGIVDRYPDYSSLTAAELRGKEVENKEGYVVRYKRKDGRTFRVKAKLESYMKRHLFVSSLSKPRLLDVYVNGKKNGIESIKARDEFAMQVPDEFFERVIEWWTEYEDSLAALRALFEENYKNMSEEADKEVEEKRLAKFGLLVNDRRKMELIWEASISQNTKEEK